MNLRKNKLGMTLIEMMMAIAIFSIGIEGFALLFTRAWKNNSFVVETGEASMAASRGVQKTVDVVRRARQADNGSYPIISANENEFVFYSDIDKDGLTERVHYYREANSLKVGITDPAGAPPVYPSGDQNVQTIANYVANDATHPIFSYYDENYPADEVNNPMTTPASVSDIRMAKIHLMINIDPDNAPDYINIQSLVALRNLSEYDRAH
ncbi:MAG: prepilin-type N-terminal cleavage/methylation domain-containing protein [Candidatus Moranbacteria bacterium]|jgi:prepilin-type N-terminal cleavage/methylation domain-containing protein|nr:prepilin-type N-terminal cleavage/methylation domain-containing protein [Candidatus Moranbacteria bacterium]